MFAYMSHVCTTAMRSRRHHRANAVICRQVEGFANPLMGNSTTELARSSTRRSHAPPLSKQATCTAKRIGSSRRMSSIICRSVPPGSNRVRKTATGIRDEFTVGHLSKRSAT
jgi:hypothetical protein